jgi:hypothetical protein
MDTSNDGVVTDALRLKPGSGYFAMDSYFTHLLVIPPSFDLTDLAHPVSLITMPTWEEQNRMGESNLKSVQGQFEFEARKYLREEASTMRIFLSSKYIGYGQQTSEQYVQERYNHYRTDHGVKYYRTVLLEQILDEGRCEEFRELPFT